MSTSSSSPSLLSRLILYMGDKKYLLSLSLVLSAISSILALLPFLLLWLIVREYFSTAPSINNVTLYAWLTLINTDKIVALKEGRVIETGTPEQLKSQGGVFAGMLARQEN